MIPTLSVTLRRLSRSAATARSRFVGRRTRHQQRSTAEDAMRFQALLLDVVGQGVIATDLEGHVVYWNQAAERIFGWSSVEVLGKEILSVTSFEPQHLAEHAMSLAALGERWTGDFWSRRRDGTLFPMLVTNTPTRDATGDVTGMVGVITDISERIGAEEDSRRLSSIVEASTDAIYGTDLEGSITSWNAGAAALYGYSPGEVLGRDVRMLYPETMADVRNDILDSVRAGLPFQAHDTVRLRRDGTIVEVSVKASPVFDASGRPIAAAAIARDITDRKRLERMVARDRDQLADAQRIAKMGSFTLDMATGKQVWSAELYRILDVDPATVPDDAVYMAAVHPDDRARLRAAIVHANRSHQPLGEIEHRVALASGAVRWVSTRANQKADGRIVGAVLDITERKLAQETLTHLSLHDPLTGLANRTMLERRLKDLAGCVTATDSRSTAVMYLDVDRFKIINDALGHQIGDELLVAIAERLSTWAGAHDTVARFGGDEFVILCEQVGDMRDAVARAAELVQLCEQPFTVGERQLIVTVSVGVAELSTGADVEHVLGEADAAMYSAKDHGRGRVVVADQASRARAAARLELETELRVAVDEQQFCLQYQPVIDLTTNAIVGYEALLRWNHPTRGQIAPDNFIALAEETGLIVPIGRWALRQALIQLTTWRTQTAAMDTRFVAVNLSTVQLYDVDLAREVRQALSDTTIRPHFLHLEITETALMDIERATRTLDALKSIGVDIELDDFGTGYSSLSYLQRLPIDTIKIDRSFVDGLGLQSQDTSIVAAVVSLGKALGLRVLAEGVETLCQRDQLQLLGCSLGQGYLWSQPLPADQVVSFRVPARARLNALVDITR